MIRNLKYVNNKCGTPGFSISNLTSKECQMVCGGEADCKEWAGVIIASIIAVGGFICQIRNCIYNVNQRDNLDCIERYLRSHISNNTFAEPLLKNKNN